MHPVQEHVYTGDQLLDTMANQGIEPMDIALD